MSATAQRNSAFDSSAAPPGLKFSIVIPTYNEADGIERLIVALYKAFTAHQLDGEIIVVDDNSPDGTGVLVDRLAATYPVRCLHRPAKMGLSSGVIDGWRCVRPESDAVGVMDADFSIGSRYIKGGGISNWPLKRKITSLVAIALAKPLTPVRDITSGFFIVRRRALDGVTLDPVGFKIGLEVIAKAHYGRAIEVPYVFTDRVAGTSKLNQREIFNYLCQLGRIYRSRLLGN
jgi:dolichol-phosphate mannosyltransferase